MCGADVLAVSLFCHPWGVHRHAWAFPGDTASLTRRWRCGGLSGWISLVPTLPKIPDAQPISSLPASRRQYVLSRRPIHRVLRIVADLPHPPVAQVQLLLFRQVQRPGADAAEDGDLVAALVDGAVAVQAA